MRATRGAVVVALVLATAGCGTGGGNGVDPGASGPAPSLDPSHAGLPVGALEGSRARAGLPVPSAAAASSSRSASLAFGRWFHYGSGLWAKVDAAKPFTPSPWVEPADGRPLRFAVTIRNRTGSEWNPSQLHVRLTSGLALAAPIFDYEKRVVARPEERLPDKGSVSFDVGFWVPDTTQLAVELSPGFGYESVVVDRAEPVTSSRN